MKTAVRVYSTHTKAAETIIQPILGHRSTTALPHTHAAFLLKRTITAATRLALYAQGVATRGQAALVK